MPYSRRAAHFLRTFDRLAETVCILLATTLPAMAQTQAESGALSPICTDRPTKTTYACAVDAGHFQVEGDIANESVAKQGGVTTDTLLVINPTLKYGISPGWDVETNFSPLVNIRTSIPSQPSQTVSGVGDLYLKTKYEFVNTEDGVWQMAVLPYLKAPTAPSGIGNGAVEGGVMLPVNYKINDTFLLSTAPEVDAYKDALDDGRHVNTAQSVNLFATLPHDFALIGEVWGDWNFDSTGTVRQYSADIGLLYGITPYLQIDAGLNYGLNRTTPQTQFYLGLSQKF